MTLPDPPLLLITGRHLAKRPLAEVAAEAFRAGCRWIMVREKDLDTGPLAALASGIVAAAKPFAATVTVNGDAEAARLAGAAGVHLPQGRPVADGFGLVGVSAHSRREAEAAMRAGAGYVTFSPVFASVSKPGYGPEGGGEGGLERLAETARAVSCPVIALGGVAAHNAAACLAAGAAGVAVLGAVMQADDPFAETAALVAALRGVTRNRA